MHKRTNQIGFFLFFFVGLIAACLLYRYSTEPVQAKQKTTYARIFFLPKVVDANNDFWEDVTAGAKLAAFQNDVAINIMGPDAETKYEVQNQMIEKAISMQPNSIALCPSSFDKTVPYAQKIKDAGIKLILIDSVMNQDIADCVVATDNFAAGRKMGLYMHSYADDNTVIGIVEHVKGSSTATDREAGLRSGLGQYADKIVDVEYSNSNYDIAYQVTQKMLKDHPDINMIFGLNEYSSVGAARAVKDLGLTGKIRMVGFDSSIEEVKLLEEGVFEAIVIQKPVNMGYLGVSMAYREAHGDTTVPKKIDSGSELITRDNIYTEENEKLLFRFRENE